VLFRGKTLKNLERKLKRLISEIMLVLVLIGVCWMEFGTLNYAGMGYEEKWVQYVPNAGQVELYFWKEADVSYVNVSIWFPTSGYNISSWGTPIFEGNNITINAEIWKWTGFVAQVVITRSNIYNLGNLSPGEYLFTFEVWEFPVKNITFTVFITAAIDINPKTLSIRSKGEWILVHIELPESYSVAEINVLRMMLNNTVPSESEPIAIEDFDNDAILDLMVNFNRTAIISYILTNVNTTKLFEERSMVVALTITGYLNDETPFQGSATITIMLPTPKSGFGRHRCQI